jgi:hypothetical protein
VQKERLVKIFLFRQRNPGERPDFFAVDKGAEVKATYNLCLISKIIL